MEVLEELKTILEIIVILTALAESPLLLATAVAAVWIYLLMTDGNDENDNRQ